MRIATFNLESFGTDKADDPALERRIVLLAPQIARLGADILCLQEINAQRVPGEDRRPIALERLVAGLPQAGFFRVWSGDLAGAPDIHTLAIFSRYPFASASLLHHHLVDPPLWRRRTGDPPDADPVAAPFDRPVLKAEIALPCGRPLHLFNVHLRAPRAAPIPGGKESASVWSRVDAWAEGYAIAAMKRIGQALELRCAMDRIFDAEPDARIAAVGDFNADAAGTALRIALGDVDDTGNPALRPRSLVAVERTLPEDLRYSVIHAGRPLMLDHILVSRTLHAGLEGVAIHNEGLADEAGPTGESTEASFHAPLMATFRD